MGKELKVIENELSFGGTTRIVNVFGAFRYKKTNGLYVVYSDVGTTYNIIYYGSSHVKNGSLLSMSCKDEDVEIVKEYIFKVTSKQVLDDFEMIPLDDINGIEIISSNRLEVKPEVLATLVDLTIPKKSEVLVENKQVSKKRGGFSKALLVLVVLLVVVGGGYYYFSTLSSGEDITKTVTCVKTSSERSLNASLEEKNLYRFDTSDSLKSIESTFVYRFNTKEDYENFIYNGTMYRYMPSDEKSGGYNKNDDEHSFTVIVKETVDDSYDKPTNYEEVLSYYKRDGYTCDEELLRE